MRIGRAIIAPVVLALGTTGLILAASAAPVAAAQAPAAHGHSTISTAEHNLRYHA